MDFMFGIVIDTGRKVYPSTWPKTQGHRIFMFAIYNLLVFARPLINLINVWIDDWYWSHVLRIAILTQVCDLKVKVTYLEFL